MTSNDQAETLSWTLAQSDNEANFDESLFQLPTQRCQKQTIVTFTNTEDISMVAAGPKDSELREQRRALRPAIDSSELNDKLRLTNTAFERLASGDSELLRGYLDAGAIIEHENHDGLTLLVTAIKNSNVSATRLLLQKGADAQHRAQARPPLFHAVQNQEHGAILIRLLLDHGANINTTCGLQRMNALHWAATAGMIDAANYLLSRGIDTEATCAGEHTALHVAAGTGHTTVVKLLLAQGADLAKRGESGGNVLSFAASMGHQDIVKLCVEQGLPVDECNDKGPSESNLGVAKCATLARSNIYSRLDERMRSWSSASCKIIAREWCGRY